MTKWTKDRIAKARAALGKHTSIGAALADVSSAVGFAVTGDSMKAGFRAVGAAPPSSFLGTAPLVTPERDLVAEREAKLAAERDKRAASKLVDEVRELRARQRFIDATAGGGPPVIPRRERSGTREMTAVARASDWHFEETVDPESVAGRNEYNLDVAAARIERFFQAIAWHVEHQRGSGKIAVHDLVLWLGGDLITGYIHEELQESNALSPTETMLWLEPRLEGGIRGLLDRLDLASIVVPCSYGNHGRTTQKKRISTGHANTNEWLMYHHLLAKLKDEKRVCFEVTASPHQYVRTYDQVIHFHHGDSLKYQGGVGGIAIPLLKAVPQWDRTVEADVHCIGHFHQLRDFGRAVVNGSLIGFNGYAQEIRAEFEPPQQALFYMDSKRGKVMNTKLWVEDREGGGGEDK
jgi:hypothetical protein